MNGNAGDGVFSLVGGIALLLLIATAKCLDAIIVSALAGAAVQYHLFNTNRNISDARNEFINASFGWGLWVATIGAVLAFAGSIALWQEASSLTEDSSSHCRRGEAWTFAFSAFGPPANRSSAIVNASHALFADHGVPEIRLLSSLARGYPDWLVGVASPRPTSQPPGHPRVLPAPVGS